MSQTFREDKGEEIYANLPIRGSPVEDKSPSDQKSGLKLWAAGVAVLCGVLLGVITALSILTISSSIERNKLHDRICGLAVMVWEQYAVNITLDPDTAYPKLRLSADGKKVNLENMPQKVHDSPKRFTKFPSVLAKQGFGAGRIYYEVQVSRERNWTLGVVKESINISRWKKSPQHGVWSIWLKGSKYSTDDGQAIRDIVVPQTERPERVGVFVDYESSLVSFYDADRWKLLWSLRGIPFKEKIYPYFFTRDPSPMTIIKPAFCKK